MVTVSDNGFQGTIDAAVITTSPCLDNGTISLSVLHDYYIDQVVWSDAAANTYYGSELYGLTAGDYNYELRDENGCTASGTVTVLSLSNLLLQHTDMGCTQEVLVLGGNAPYTVTWYKQVEQVNSGQTDILSVFTASEQINTANTAYPFVDLPEGEYIITVRDRDGCT